MNQWDSEMEQLEHDLMNGLISNAEYQKQMREIQRDYSCAAQEAAWDAHERELDNWR